MADSCEVRMEKTIAALKDSFNSINDVISILSSIINGILIKFLSKSPLFKEKINIFDVEKILDELVIILFPHFLHNIFVFLGLS